MSSDNNQSKERGQWSSSFGFIMAAAGSAVGLGNLWRFPYLVGENGGSAFLIIYLLFVIFIGLSLVIAEISVGRAAQLNPVGAFNLISPKLKWVGAMGILTGFVIISYYPVVGGWILYYLYHSFADSSASIDYAQLFSNYTSNTTLSITTLLIYSLLSYGIVVGGIEKGIEKYSRIMMPALFVILFIVIVRTATLEGSWQGIKFLLQPDFSKVTVKTIFEAMGQVFFSLSLGMGALMTYGSYMKKNDNIFNSAVAIPFIDTGVAFFAALAIIPAVFAFGAEPNQGPALIFITLPAIFAKMPMGTFVSVIFFILMLFAALTSSISMLEGLVAYMIDNWKWKRFNATTFVSIVIFLTGIPCALSFGLFKDFTLLPGKTVFDTLDFLASNILLPFGGFMLSVSVGWLWDRGLRYKTTIIEDSEGNRIVKNGYVFNKPLQEITNDGKLNFPFMSAWIFTIKWICPLIILAIFLYNL